jgi:hypothetical protein
MPPNGTLAPYELGYDCSSGYLYIGGPRKEVEIEGRVEYTNGDTLKVYAEGSGIANSFTNDAIVTIKGIKVNNAVSADSANQAIRANGVKSGFFPPDGSNMWYRGVRNNEGINDVLYTGDGFTMPAKGAWHIINCRHVKKSLGEGTKIYTTYLALPVLNKYSKHSGSIHFKRISEDRIVNGSVNNGWVKVLDVENF